jgi:uncharacterized phage protein (TIGR02220 family)
MIKRGQFLTSVDTLTRETGLSVSQIRTSLKKLISTNEIASKSQARSTIITVLEYESHQGDDKQASKVLTLKSQDSDNEIATDKNVKNDNNVKEVIKHLNTVINSKYKTSTKSHIENISARLNDGHSVDDLKAVINFKSREWLSDEKMAQYLRPSTLFSASKFQGYLTQSKPMINTNSPKAFSQ